MIEGNGDMTVGNYKLGLVENICTKEICCWNSIAWTDIFFLFYLNKHQRMLYKKIWLLENQYVKQTDRRKMY
jgi:hypothetical protein